MQTKLSDHAAAMLVQFSTVWSHANDFSSGVPLCFLLLLDRHDCREVKCHSYAQVLPLPVGAGDPQWSRPCWNSQTFNASARPTTRAAWVQMLQPVRPLWQHFGKLVQSTTKSTVQTLCQLQGCHSIWWLWQTSQRNHIQASWGGPEPAQLFRAAGARDEEAHLQ